MQEAKPIVENVAEIIGPEWVRSERADLTPYAVDGCLPKAVVFPKNVQQVSDIVRYANRENLAIVPRGSGSKISFGNPPNRLDLVLCTSRMNHMKDVDTANLTLTVEAGVRFLDVQARLATEDDRCYLPLEDLTTTSGEMICSDRSHSGCFLPIDAPFCGSATIGGIIASDSNGPRRLLYNLVRDTILGCRFVAPTGEIIGTGGKTVKNVSGYDISKLMVGSAGSLGIICDVTLRLLPLPEKMKTLLFSFAGFSDAALFADRVLQTRLLPAAVEVINAQAFDHLKFEKPDGFRNGGPYIAAVALEAYREALDRMHTEMDRMAAASGLKAAAWLEEEQHRQFWLGVGDLVPAMAGRYPGLLAAQLNYPLSDWKGIAEYAAGILDGANLPHTLLAHAGSGLCLINVLLNGDDADRKNAAVDALRSLRSRCRGSGGNLVLHRAPVEVKQQVPVWGEPGPDILIMRRIKETVDPRGIMSPGRYLDGL